jgi:hypothetical protein
MRPIFFAMVQMFFVPTLFYCPLDPLRVLLLLRLTLFLVAWIGYLLALTLFYLLWDQIGGLRCAKLFGRVGGIFDAKSYFPYIPALTMNLVTISDIENKSVQRFFTRTDQFK